MLWITRPEEDGAQLQASLAALGVQSHVAPLIEPIFQPVSFPPVAGFTGLVATSRNGLQGAVRSGLPAGYFQLPLFVVGKASFATAKELGFEDVRYDLNGRGAEDLPPFIERSLAPAAALLWLRGDKAAFDLGSCLATAGFHVDECLTYQMNECDRLADETVALLKSGAIDGVILMSARTAKVYCHLMTSHELTTLAGQLCHFCLSPMVGRELAALGAVAVEIASRPCQNSLIELVARHQR